jgi:hypothetical protein
MNGIGLCAVFSRQGDWAFDYALSLARHYQTKLNIFHFLESPYMLRRDVVFVDSEKKGCERCLMNVWVTMLKSDSAFAKGTMSGN